MSEKSLSIAGQEAFGAAVNIGTLDFDELVGPDAIDHDSAPGQGPAPLTYRALFTELRTAFSDLHIEVQHVTTTDDDVAFAYTITGTHAGSFQGHAATTKTFKVRGMQIGRFADGKLVERWGSSDQLGVLTQLGLVQV